MSFESLEQRVSKLEQGAGFGGYVIAGDFEIYDDETPEQGERRWMQENAAVMADATAKGRIVLLIDTGYRRTRGAPLRQEWFG